MYSMNYLFSTPFTIQIDITNKCNLACLYCYADSGTETAKPLSLKQWKEVIREIAEFGVPSLLFSGGEPLLSDFVFKLANYSKKNGIQQNRLNTNATLINTKSTAKKIKKNFKVVATNIDGTEKTHDMLRGSALAFSKTIKGIEMLHSAGFEGRLNINTLITSKNFQELPQIFKIADSTGFFEHRLLPFIPNGRGRTNQNLAIKPDCWKFVKSQVLYRLRKQKNTLLAQNAIYFLKNEAPKEIYFSGCNAGKFSAVISTNGEVYPCNVGRSEAFSAGNILENSIKEIWRKNRTMKWFRNFKIKEKKCLDCKKKLACNGGCRAWAHYCLKNKDATDPRCGWMNGKN